jgi:hypothetical protein
MKTERHPSESGGSTTKARREPQSRVHRARPTPKWLLQRKDLDEIAQRRCVLVLEVLSGAKPVTDAIAEGGISRGTYYKLEERALNAMLTALSPAVGPDGTETSALQAALGKAAELEEKLADVEKERRRTERLSLLIGKLKRGPLTTGAGRPPGRKSKRSSGRSGTGSTRTSPTSTTTSPATTGPATASTPTPAGAGGR